MQGRCPGLIQVQALLFFCHICTSLLKKVFGDAKIKFSSPLNFSACLMAHSSFHSKTKQKKKREKTFLAVTELASDTLQKYSVILLYPVWLRFVFWGRAGGSNLKLKQSKAEVQGHGITRT